MREDEKAYLYKYVILRKSIAKVYNETVYEKSKPIVGTDGSILFISNLNDNYIVKLIEKIVQLKN